MFIHVVAEVLEQRDFLVQRFWIHFQRVKVLGAIALYVLHVSATV